MQLKVNFQQYIFNLSLCSKVLRDILILECMCQLRGEWREMGEEEEGEIEKREKGEASENGGGGVKENQVKVEKMIRDKITIGMVRR